MPEVPTEGCRVHLMFQWPIFLSVIEAFAIITLERLPFFSLVDGIRRVLVVRDVKLSISSVRWIIHNLSNSAPKGVKLFGIFGPQFMKPTSWMHVSREYYNFMIKIGSAHLNVDRWSVFPYVADLFQPTEGFLTSEFFVMYNSLASVGSTTSTPESLVFRITSVIALSGVFVLASIPSANCGCLAGAPAP